jgi:hypothetical protein
VQPITKGDDFRIICAMWAADAIVCESTFEHRPEGLHKTASRHVLLDERGPTQAAPWPARNTAADSLMFRLLSAKGRPARLY